jgi:hypothetical protein
MAHAFVSSNLTYATFEGVTGIEPVLEVLQTSTLPLGYTPIMKKHRYLDSNQEQWFWRPS